MNITKFIKSSEKLNRIPFIYVYFVLMTLYDMGKIKDLESDDVGEI